MTTRSGCGPVTAPAASRTVNCGSSASTVPMPTIMVSTRARRACTSARDCGEVIHRLVPSAAATRPSIVIPTFQLTNGRCRRVAVSQTRLTSSAAATASDCRLRGPCRTTCGQVDDVDARGPRSRSIPPAAGGQGSPDRDHRPGDARRDQRLRTRTGPPGVIAGFEGDDRRCAARPLAGRRDRHHLGVRPAGPLVKSLADCPAAGRQQHAADDRIRQRRTGAAGRPARRRGARRRSPAARVARLSPPQSA